MYRRPKICFFMGYGNMFDHRAKKIAENIYGSELALYHLAHQLAKHCDVYVTSLNFWGDEDFDGLHYIHYDHLKNGTHTFDVMVVWRFINYFMLFPASEVAKKTVFWFHDTAALPWWDFKPIPEDGVALMTNILSCVHKVIVLTASHKKQIMEKYHIRDEDKIAILGNALCPLEPSNQNSRIENRFIWTSAYGRGLRQLVEFFPRIRELLPNAELHVMREPDPGMDVSYLEGKPFLRVYGFVSNDEVQKHMQMADYWFYPTHFEETYCISALEAQRSGCVCIATAFGALNEIVADRGILLHKPIYSDEYWEEALAAIRHINSDRVLKESYRKRGQEWAQLQTWETRTQEWFTVLDIPRVEEDLMKDYIRTFHKCMGIPQDHKLYLENLAAQGFKPNVIYDIGSCALHWAREVKRIWPESTIIAFDAWESVEFLYKEHGYQYHIGVLTDCDDKEVTFYSNDEWPGGNSYYREIGHSRSEELFPESCGKKTRGCTLDTVVTRNNFPLPDLVKIDVQGAEVDILNGGRNTISHARHMIVELQSEQYNKDAPLLTASLPFIESLGWKTVAPLFCDNGPDGDYGFERALNMKRPRICLNMIVKNEEHIIRQSLYNLLPWIDYWVICDTGSTDSTKDCIRSFFAEKGVDGVMFDHEWRDFGHNRSLAMDEAWKLRHAHKCDFIFVFDADDRIEGTPDLSIMETKDVYEMKMGTAAFTYMRQILFRCADELRWGYKGVLHEFPYCITKDTINSGIIPGQYFVCSQRLGARSLVANKYERDGEILSNAILTELDPGMVRRYAFYAGQSYFDARMDDKSMHYYEMRTQLGGWQDEIYISFLRIANIKERSSEKYTHDDIKEAYLKAHASLPSRAEALHDLAHYLRHKNMFEDAYKYAKQAQSIPYPPSQALFVRMDVYDYRIDDEVAISAYYIGKKDECKALCEKILASSDISKEERDRIIKNRAFCE